VESKFTSSSENTEKVAMLFPSVVESLLDAGKLTSGNTFSGYNISEQCHGDLHKYATGWDQRELWAMRSK
jgi:hypothetical protein